MVRCSVQTNNAAWSPSFSYSSKEVSSRTENTRARAPVNGFWLPLTEPSYDDIECERMGANIALQFQLSVGHALALRLNHHEFSKSEARQNVVLYVHCLGTLTNQTVTSGANRQGRASHGERDGPTCVDWEYRAAAGAFPGTYDYPGEVLIKPNNEQRGFVRCEVTPKNGRTDFRTVPYLTRRGAALATRATWVVEAGRAQLNRA